MRLWHIDLIPVLPKQQLVSQWRECIAIKRQWEKGTLKHRLVSYVKNSPIETFQFYVLRLIDEFHSRGYSYRKDLVDEILEFNPPTDKELKFHSYYPEHNERYLKQCFYNLQEKYDRGIISDDEWKVIEELKNDN